jgi:hypothetical protein
MQFIKRVSEYIIIIIYLARNGKFPTKRLNMPKSLAVTQLSITRLSESWGLRLTVIVLGKRTQKALEAHVRTISMVP